MDYVVRINLKTDCGDRRRELVDYCLHGREQCVAIGWSCTNIENKVDSYQDYKTFYYATKAYIKKKKGKINPALNLFRYVKEDDLFWTRDLEGFYWICRAKGVAIPEFKEELDIGAKVPVEAFKVGTEVPGMIKASFNRANGGITQKLGEKEEEKIIVEYSKYIYNELSGFEYYKDIQKREGCIVNNLDPFDLEELVISYVQIKDNYYLLSNSIASKSTTPLIECVFISRDVNNPRKAVVQVKGMKQEIYTSDYTKYRDEGYDVYLYSAKGVIGDSKGYKIITTDELLSFYKEYKRILPESITKWENLFS